MLKRTPFSLLLLFLTAPLLAGCINLEEGAEDADQVDTRLQFTTTLTDKTIFFKLVVNETLLLERDITEHSDGHWRSSINAIDEWRLLRASMDGLWQVQIQDHSAEVPELFEGDLPLSHEFEITPHEYLIVLESVHATTEFSFSSDDAYIEMLDSNFVGSSFFTSWDDEWDSELRIEHPLFGHHSGSTTIPVESEAETMIQVFAQKRWLETPHCTREGVLDIGERVIVSADQDMDIAIDVTSPTGRPLVILHTLFLPPETIDVGCQVDRP